MNQIIPPKGNLVNLVVSGEEKQEIERRLKKKNRIIIDNRAQTDLLLIATGVYSPITGFMGKKDYNSVIHDMHLSNGTLWSLPITLPVDNETASMLKVGKEIGLTDENGILLGILFLKEKYSYDKLKEAELVFRTTDEKHPGVARLLSQGEVLLGGDIRLIERPATPFPDYYYDPVEMRRIIAEKGWKTVVAFQTRNPIHRAHEYIQKCALELVDGLLVHPLVGHTKADDVPADVRIKSYEVLFENYYPPERTMLGVFPAYMRYAGPREAVFHAICRRNYGCTHMIVGRDHAGVGNYYGTYDAQKLLLSLPPEELGITPLCFEHSFYCKACGSMASEKTCPHTNEDRLILSGTKVREMLRNGEELPAEFSRKEVAAVLREAYSNKQTTREQDDQKNLDLIDVIESGYFDLHMHSTASDGIHSPRDLVKMARAAGLKTIAITDHDTLDGIGEAQQAGMEYGVTIIPGIELSTKYKGRSVDILGYNVSESDELKAILSQMREGREQRALRIIEKFAELDMTITLDDVKQFSKGDVIARPHIAMAIVEKGYVSDYQTVFDEYLADGKPCALDKVILSVEEGIGLIHRAGGKAVMAHPLLLGDDELVRELLQFPFDGIEVWHRKQNDDDNDRYQRLANEFQLIMTGGSDFHRDEHTLGQFGLKWDQGIQAESSKANVVWHKTKVEKTDRNQLNGHKSFVLWFTGLSGAGKSTLAVEIEKELFQRGIRCFLLDGDNIRHGLNKNLSFNPEDRSENIRRIGEVSKLFVEAGLISIAASISPYIADRAMVRSLVSEGDFIEVYVKCSLEECERRDPKGLYKKSRAGEIKGFTGITAPYEPPANSEITIETDKMSVSHAVDVILHYLEEKGYLPGSGTVNADGPLDHD